MIINFGVANIMRTNYSPKREAIYEIIASTKVHPDAERIYSEVKKTYPEISLGTVYRNLVHLRNSGKIKSLGVIKGCERFDADMSPHSHFICNTCGRVIDVGDLFSIYTQRLDKIVEKELCVEVESHDLVFYGICGSCNADDRS